MKRFLLSILFFVGVVSLGFGQTNFTATQDGNWNIGTTWGGTCTSGCIAGTDYPAINDDAFTNGFNISVTSPASVRNLFVNDGSTAITFSGALLTISGTLIGWSGGEFGFSTEITFNTFSGPSQIIFTGANFNGAIPHGGFIQNAFNNEIIFNWNDNTPITVGRFNLSGGFTIDTGFSQGDLQFLQLLLLNGNLSTGFNISGIKIQQVCQIVVGTLSTQVPIYGLIGENSFVANLAISNGGTLTLGTSASYANSSNVSIGPNSTLNVGFNGSNQEQGWWFGELAPNNFNLNVSSNINYNANTNQNVFAISQGYGNLSVNSSNTAVKSLVGEGNLLVKGDFSIESGSVTFTSSNTNPITFQGNVTNEGSWNTTQRVNFIGSNSQTINGSNPIVFGEEFRIDKSSGNVTLQLVDQTINADLRILQGTFRPLARTITLSGDIINDGTIEAIQNGAGGFTFEGTSEISGTGTTQFRNIIINSGASLTPEAGSEFEVTTNFTNNGTFTHNEGLVRFRQAGTKNIAGSNPTSFYDLAIEDNGTVNVNGTVDLENVMTFAGSPTVDFDGGGSGVFTLKSTETRDAAIGDKGSATLQGIATVERAIYNVRSDGKGYHLMGFPLSGVSVADLQSEIGITGSFTGADTGYGSSDGFASVFYYDETLGGGIDDRYVEFPDANNSETFSHGLGYYVFTYDGEAPTVVDGRGTLFSGTFNPTITLTAGPTSDDGGWNLISNPYPAPTDWGAWSKTDIEGGGAAHIYNVSTESFEVITAGNIPQGQAFYVRATSGSASLTATEATKVTGTSPTFYRESQPEPLVGIALNKGETEDITYVGFKENATDAYEGTYDASRFLNFVETISTLSSDNKKLKINQLAKTSTNECLRSVFISLEKMKNSKEYGLKFYDLDLFGQYSFVLKDHYLDESIVLNNSSMYKFTVNSDAASKGQTRFELLFESKQPNSVSTIVNDVCPENNAKVRIQNTDSYSNYIIYRNNELISSAKGNGSEIELEVSNEFLDSDINNFEIKAFVEGCDTVTVGNAQIQVKEELNLDNVVNGSSICKAETQAPFSILTQLGASYSILSGQDTIQSIQGTGNVYEGFISSKELKDGLNEFIIAAEKDACQSGTLTDALEINLQNLSINESIEFSASDVCLESPTTIDFASQADVAYQVYKGNDLVNSVLGDDSNQSIEISDEFLSLGKNEFSILAVYGECSEFEYTEKVQIEVEESINQDLSLSTLNSCGVQQVSVIIENAQSGKTYSLLSADENILSNTAVEDGEMTFDLDSSLFQLGSNEFEILIEGQNCESKKAYTNVEFGFFNSVVIEDVADQNICLNDTLSIDLSANVDLVNYQLYVGEKLIMEDVGSNVNLAPTETTTYSLTGIHENGCDVNTINFKVEVTDLATPGILVSGNVLESSIDGDSYQWFLDGELLANETGKVIVASQAGDYAVEVTKANCSNLSDAFTFNEEVLNANKALNKSLKLYPNPVEEKMFIELDAFKSVDVTIFNLSGQFIDGFKLDASQSEIDMSKFSKGTYLIQFESEKASVTKRIIKQ